MPILEVPLVYTARVVMPSRSIWENLGLVEQLPLRVREVSSGEAPVVARASVVPAASLDEVEKGRGPEPAVVEYRAIDGNMMRPLAPAGQAQALMGRWCRQFAEGRYAGHYDGLYPFMPEQPPPSRRGVRLRAELRAREYIDDDREARVAALTAWWGRAAAVVDGVLYVPSHGPGWVVLANGMLPGSHTLICAVDEYGHVAPRRRPDAFRGDKPDEARAAEVRHAHRLPGGGARPAPLGAVEVLDAAAFRVDDHHFALRQTADEALEWMRQEIGRASIDVLRPFYEVSANLAQEPGYHGGGIEADSLLMSLTEHHLPRSQGFRPLGHR